MKGFDAAMTYRYSIPLIPESMNRYAGRENCWEYRNAKKGWADLVILLCRPRPSAPIQHSTVRLTYYFPTRARHDPDNYAGKMILDGLVAAGILEDDSFHCITLELAGKHDKHNPRTEIEIEEANGP